MDDISLIPTEPQGPQSAPPPPAQPDNHANLRGFIQNLALGVDSFAKAAASGGREGGVQEVQQARAAQQEMALKQQAAQQSAQDHALRMKMATADFNMKQAQLASFIQDMPQKHQLLADEVQNSMIDLLTKKGVPLSKAVAHVEGQSTDQHISGVNTAAGGDFTSNYAIPVYGDKGVGGGSGKTYVVPNSSVMGMSLNSDDVGSSVAAMSRVVDEARSVLGDKDPAVLKAQGQLDFVNKGLANGGTIGMPDWLRLGGTVNTELHAAMSQKKDLMDFQAKQADLKEKQQKSDPLFKIANDPTALAGENATAAIPQLQNKITDPQTSPQDRVQATRLLAVAKAARQGHLNDQISKANADQAAKQGDPLAAGKMLADGDLTLADMKTRGMTPKFIMDAVNGAKKVDPTYKPADEIAAERVANSPEQNKFFGSANSLIAKGGTLDQLMDAGSKLPDYKFPTFNKAADVLNYASGHKEVAGYLQTALGVADDYAKVTGGGAGTEGMQMHILNSLTAALNQETRKEVTDRMRGAVNSQVDSRIGKNKMLRRMYGGDLPSQVNTQFDPAKDFNPINQ